jgi:hypothetical protein
MGVVWKTLNGVFKENSRTKINLSSQSVFILCRAEPATTMRQTCHSKVNVGPPVVHQGLDDAESTIL